MPDRTVKTERQYKTKLTLWIVSDDSKWSCKSCAGQGCDKIDWNLSMWGKDINIVKMPQQM